MNDDEMKRPIEWASRINRRWIVHHGLGTRAEDWLNHLSEADPSRLRRSCEAAYSMVRKSDNGSDPKPWFYAGLFSTATAAETRKFLAGHRLTTATVPAMEQEPEVREWESSLCTETCGLLKRLRMGLREMNAIGRTVEPD